ncbi:MAG: cytochrome o ubiquinol oxidase subunit IV [Thiobacillus sp.]|nr:cytochrome o ubiquinol oxidase subunit IV [Thiobacillus sp.]
MSHTPRSHARRAYLAGYAAALLLTLLAFGAVWLDVMSRSWTLALITVAGTLQVIVHLRCFLHLGVGASHRDELLLVLFAVLLIALMVGGSAWIMTDLNQRMM